MSTWNGMLVRVNQSDDGTEPRSVTSNSPDIECNGSGPMSQTELDKFVSTAGYAQQTANSVYLNQPNYLYVRGKNISQASINGFFQLYWAPSSLILSPSLWSQNSLQSSARKSIAFSATAGQIVGTTSDAFYWNPQNPPTGTHYCLMAQASSSSDPSVGIPTENWADGAAMADWFATNGNWGWKNTVDVPGTASDWVSTHNLTIPGKPGTWALYHIYFDCTDVSTSWNFQFSSATVIPGTPPKPNGSNTVAIPSQKPGEPYAGVGASWYLPAGFTTVIQANVWFNGVSQPSKNTHIVFRCNQVTQDKTLSIYKTGKPISKNVLRDHPTITSDMPIGVEVTVGNVNFQFPGNLSDKLPTAGTTAAVQKGTFSQLGSTFISNAISSFEVGGAKLTTSGSLSSGGQVSIVNDPSGAYPVITLGTTNKPTSDANIQVSSVYEQTVPVDTLELKVLFSPGFPAGIQFSISSSNFRPFEMGKQPATGIPCVSAPATAAFSTDLGLSLWIPEGTNTSGASITLQTFEVKSSGSIGKEIPIAKMIVNLP